MMNILTFWNLDSKLSYQVTKNKIDLFLILKIICRYKYNTHLDTKT